MLLTKAKEKIRYAVIGLGHIAQVAVLPAFAGSQENSELVALVSGDQEKLQTLGKKYGVTKLYLYSEFETCLKNKEVDAIYISTPNAYHRNIMETAARYGVHVICEKPMAVTSEDCLSMIQETEKNNVSLMIAYRLHFEAANLEVARLAHAKKIGELKVFNSVFTIQVEDRNNIRLREDEEGGGALYDIGIYCINAARNLFKAEPTEVFATAVSSKDSRFKETDETVSAILKFSEGRIANFTVSLGAFASADYDLIGSKGRIRLEKGYTYQKAMTLRTYEDKKTISRKYPKRDQFAQELIYFSDCVQRGKKPEASGEEGLKDIKVIEALLLSIDLGTPIRLDDVVSKRPRLPTVVMPKISRPSFFRSRLFGEHRH